MSNQRFIIIGINDCSQPDFSKEILHVISKGSVFSGGRRHHELVKDFLPVDSKWIDVTVPLSEVYRKYLSHNTIIIFASGDPFFYGYGATIMREFPNAGIEVYPTFNSLQTLSHKILIPYQNMTNISLTGRDWKELDKALIKGDELIGSLTDKNKTPDAIARRMLEYGYKDYKIYIGEHLGNRITEKIHCMTLEEASKIQFNLPNCVILQKEGVSNRFFGIEDKCFEGLPGRPAMITKKTIRLATLSNLDIFNHNNFWDIGFCTGSISIEAKLLNPTINVTSFEIRKECETIMANNCRKFGVPGINIIIGDFLNEDISGYPAPDVIFIGGYGGKLKDVFEKCYSSLIRKGIIVFNSVSENSKNTFIKCNEQSGGRLLSQETVKVDNHNPITILKIEKP